MKALRFVVLCILLLLTGRLLAVASPEIYMVAKNKITGTTLRRLCFPTVMKLSRWPSVKRNWNMG